MLTLRQIGIGRLKFGNLVEMSGIVVESYVRMLCKIEKEMCQNIRQEKRLKQSITNIRYKDCAKISRSKILVSEWHYI